MGDAAQVVAQHMHQAPCVAAVVLEHRRWCAVGRAAQPQLGLVGRDIVLGLGEIVVPLVIVIAAELVTVGARYHHACPRAVTLVAERRGVAVLDDGVGLLHGVVADVLVPHRDAARRRRQLTQRVGQRGIVAELTRIGAGQDVALAVIQQFLFRLAVIRVGQRDVGQAVHAVIAELLLQTLDHVCPRGHVACAGGIGIGQPLDGVTHRTRRAARCHVAPQVIGKSQVEFPHPEADRQETSVLPPQGPYGVAGVQRD